MPPAWPGPGDVGQHQSPCSAGDRAAALSRDGGITILWPARGCSYFESKTHRVQRGPATSCPCSAPAPSSCSTSSASGLWDAVLRASSTAPCRTARRQLRHQTNPKLHQLVRSLFFTCNRKTLLKAGKTVMCFPALFLTLWCDGYHYGNDSFPPLPVLICLTFLQSSLQEKVPFRMAELN